MAARILLLEDDPAIAQTVVYALQREAMQVTHCLLLQDARRQIALARPDALVLDIGLPDGSGLDLCRELHAQAGPTRLPVLILSAQGEEIDRVLGLELGADDYLTKPFSLRELVARVKALLRRAQAPLAVAPTHGEFSLDAAGQRVTLRGQPLALTRLEYGLLADLLAHAGRIRSRSALLASVWPASDSLTTERTVDTHIKTLRNKLAAVAGEQEFIVTHRGMGYSLSFG